MREAQAYLTRRLREGDLGRDLEGAKITLNEYLDRWLETAVKPRVREKTPGLRRHAPPLRSPKPRGTTVDGTASSGPSNHLPADDATWSVCADCPLHACCAEDGYAAGGELASTAGVSGRWRQTTAAAQTRNASAAVEQVRVFLQAALATPHGPALAVAVATGMRPSEYLGLKWQDIDWPRQTVSVVRSLRRLNGRWCFADTKRSRSRRPIKLQSWVADILHDLNTSMTTTTTSNNPFPDGIDSVFRTASGRPVNADGLAKHFRSILEAADLPRIRLYDLRHTAATLALAAGVSPKVVSEQLGHASAAFTLDTYAHVLPHMQDEAATKVEAMLFGKGGLISN